MSVKKNLRFQLKYHFLWDSLAAIMRNCWNFGETFILVLLFIANLTFTNGGNLNCL